MPSNLAKPLNLRQLVLGVITQCGLSPSVKARIPSCKVTCPHLVLRHERPYPALLPSHGKPRLNTANAVMQWNYPFYIK